MTSREEDKVMPNRETVTDQQQKGQTTHNPTIWTSNSHGSAIEGQTTHNPIVWTSNSHALAAEGKTTHNPTVWISKSHGSAAEGTHNHGPAREQQRTKKNQI